MPKSSAWGVAVVLLLLAAPPAWGHGEFESSDPAPDAVVRKTPRSVSITLTEAPGPGTIVRVRDGCGKNVAEDPSRSGEVVKAAVDRGEPGEWSVRFRAVSAVDGHVTADSFTFTVRGKKDCSPDKPKKEKDDSDLAGGEDTRIKNPNPPDEGGFPIGWFAIGSAVVVGLALVLRKIATQ